MRKCSLALLILCSCSILSADVPDEITYQGRLREYNQPVNGQRTMCFKIFDALSGGNQCWTSDNQTIIVSSGVFSYALKPVTIDWRTGNYWIETTVSGKILSPREKLTSIVYALHSRTAEDLEKPSGQSIHFAIGSSTCVIVNTNGIEIESGGIKFPDNTSMTTANVGAAASVSHSGDAVITADADTDNLGDIKFKTGSSERLTVPNNGEVKSLLNGSTFYMVPRGGIIMWSGTIAAIPAGWALCDGKWYDPNNLSTGQTGQAIADASHYIQTPDLTDRFILSVNNSSENPGSTGGNNSIALAIAQLPAHSHTGTTGNESANHYHGGTTDGGGSHTPTGTANSAGAHTHEITGYNGQYITAVNAGGGMHTGPTIDGGGDLRNGWITTSDGAHTHALSMNVVENHAHSFSTGNQNANHTHSFTTGTTGSGSFIDIRPRFYKLAFIIKL